MFGGQERPAKKQRTSEQSTTPQFVQPPITTPPLVERVCTLEEYYIKLVQQSIILSSILSDNKTQQDEKINAHKTETDTRLKNQRGSFNHTITRLNQLVCEQQTLITNQADEITALKIENQALETRLNAQATNINQYNTKLTNLINIVSELCKMVIAQNTTIAQPKTKLDVALPEILSSELDNTDEEPATSGDEFSSSSTATTPVLNPTTPTTTLTKNLSIAVHTDSSPAKDPTGSPTTLFFQKIIAEESQGSLDWSTTSAPTPKIWQFII